MLICTQINIDNKKIYYQFVFLFCILGVLCGAGESGQPDSGTSHWMLLKPSIRFYQFFIETASSCLLPVIS